MMVGLSVPTTREHTPAPAGHNVLSLALNQQKRHQGSHPASLERLTSPRNVKEAAPWRAKEGLAW